MISTHKPGLRSKLDKELSRAQKTQLYFWLTKKNLTYEQAVVRLRDRYKVETKVVNLSNFYRRYCAPRLERESQIGKPAPLLDVVISRKRHNQFTIQILQCGESVALHGSKTLRCIQPRFKK